MVIQKTAAPTAKINRLYKGDIEVDHDMFKLEVAILKKNVAFEDGAETIVPIEHCHIYHTFDSRGKKMLECNAVGGHKHTVDVSVDKDGNLSAVVGPAIGGTLSDRHTHKASYIRSEKITVKQVNAEAIKMFSAYDSPIREL